MDWGVLLSHSLGVPTNGGNPLHHKWKNGNKTLSVNDK